MSTPEVALSDLSYGGLRRAAGKAAPLLVYGALPALLLAAILLASVHDHFQFDFRQFWQGGRDVVHGHSPYPASDTLPDGGDPALGPVAVQHVFRFPYPAPAALLMAPFGALPFAIAASLFLLVSLGALVVALRLLHVRDWRCYGLAAGSIVTLGALRLGTFTPLLLLGLALAWRFRNRRTVCAAAVAGVIVLKLFLCPLLVWLIATRRLGTAALAAGTAVLVTALSWAALGFAGMRGYPHLLNTLTASVQGKGWSIVSLVLSGGASVGTARAVAFAVGGALLGAAVVARRDELRCFTLALAGAIALSPIVWLHYFLLFLAPLALAAPTLSPVWFVPLLFWLSPFQETGGDAWRIALGLTAVATVMVFVFRRETEGAAA